MSYFLAPLADCRVQFFDLQGRPLNGGFVYAYAATSTTPQNTYTDSTGGTANQNPITLLSDGRTPFGVYLTSGLSYKFKLTDADGVVLWTQDVVAGINDVAAAVQDEWIASGLTPTYVSATSFTLASDQTSTFTVGRRLKTTNSGGTVYSMIENSVFGALTTITVTNDSGTLDSGLSAVSMGILRADHSSIPHTKIDTGGMQLMHSVAVAGVLSPSQITGDQNDYNPTGLSTSAVLRLSTDAARSLTGLAGGASGRLLTIDNVGSNDIVLNAENVSSTATNRFNLNAARDFTIRPNMATLLKYDATTGRWRVVGREHWTSALASGRNIAASTNAGTPNTKLDISADEIVLRDANGNAFVAQSVSGTIDFGTVGANGIDAGSQSSSTWYYGYVIAKPDGTVAVLGSTSASAPTLPTGYTFKAFVTAARSDGSTHFLKYRQGGNEVFYEAKQSALSAGTAAVETAVSLTSLVPPSAQALFLSAFIDGQSNGTNNFDETGAIRIVTGTDHWTTRIATSTAAPNSNLTLPSAEIKVPNVSQNVYYITTQTAGNVFHFSIDVMGFKLPGGGE